MIGNFSQIAHEIVDQALAPGISTEEFVENCGSVNAAVDQIVLWYTTEGEGRDAHFVDVYGDQMDANSTQFRDYVEAGLQ